MAYKSKGGCTPITAKIQKTTKGGMVTQPILNMGAPVKMKMSSPAKQTGLIGPIAEPTSSGDISLTPYSVKKEPANYVEQNPKVTKTGVIHGPKVSYDMAYEKAKKTKRYKDMSKADYIKEAKRQTKSFLGTGNWDAKPKKRKKAEATPTIKSIGIQPVSVETKLTGKIDTAKIKGKIKKQSDTQKAEPTKKQARQTKSIDKKRKQASAAYDAGNIKKAKRKLRAARNKAARVARRTAK